jgi:hypothetical protein
MSTEAIDKWTAEVLRDVYADLTDDERGCLHAEALQGDRLAVLLASALT